MLGDRQEVDDETDDGTSQQANIISFLLAVMLPRQNSRSDDMPKLPWPRTANDPDRHNEGSDSELPLTFCSEPSSSAIDNHQHWLWPAHIPGISREGDVLGDTTRGQASSVVSFHITNGSTPAFQTGLNLLGNYQDDAFPHARVMNNPSLSGQNFLDSQWTIPSQQQPQRQGGRSGHVQ